MIIKQYVLLGNHRIDEFENLHMVFLLQRKMFEAIGPRKLYVMRKIRIAFNVSSNRITSIQNGLA